MRSLLVFVAILVVSACGQHSAYPYPAEAKAHFEQSCPPEAAHCPCTWEGITRSVPYDEYEAALQRFRDTGNMDPRITRARTHCLERHGS